MTMHNIDRAVCTFWVFIWQPGFFLFAMGRLWDMLPPAYACLATIYGAFAPALLWLFLIEPWIRRWRARKQEVV